MRLLREVIDLPVASYMATTPECHSGFASGVGKGMLCHYIRISNWVSVGLCSQATSKTDSAKYKRRSFGFKWETPKKILPLLRCTNKPQIFR